MAETPLTPEQDEADLERMTKDRIRYELLRPLILTDEEVKLYDPDPTSDPALDQEFFDEVERKVDELYEAHKKAQAKAKS